MFRSDQITTPTTLIRHFSRITKKLREHPQAILITQKHEQHLVLVPVDLFENLLDCQLELELLKYQSKNSAEKNV